MQTNQRSRLWGALLLLSTIGATEAQAAHQWFSGGLENFQSSLLLQNTLSAMAAANKDIDEIGVSPQGEWVIVAGAQIVPSPGFPAGPLGKIQQYVAAGRKVDVVSFCPNGSWVVIAGDLYWRSGGLPQSQTLADRIELRIAAGQRVDEVACAADSSGWSLISGSYAQSISMPQVLLDTVYDRRASKRQIQGISVAPNGSWVLYADQWAATSGAPNGLAAVLRNRAKYNQRIDHVRLAPHGGFILYSHGPVSIDLTNKPQRVEYRLAGGTKNIWQRMDELNVRGVSIAYIEDGKVAAARSYGLREWNTEKSVLATTPFDVASLSKYITSVTAMRVIGNDFTKLDTDLRAVASQNDPANPLFLWKFWGEMQPMVFGIPPGLLIPPGMTLRRLLSHTAAAKDTGGSVGILASQYPNVVPPLWQRALGMNCSAAGCAPDMSNAAWYDPALGPPGTQSTYSNAGYLLAQGLVERLAGNSAFPGVVRNHVLTPLGMADSDMIYQPMAPVWENKAAQQHDQFGNKLERRIYWWSAAGGFYASAGDYAKAMIPLLMGGRDEEGNQFLSQQAVNIILQNNPPQTFYGLGLGLSESQVDHLSGFFRHNGSHTNRAQSLMTGRPDKKIGLVVFVNGGHDGASTLISEVQTAFREVYNW
jgi:CubicO group peptidase (beta-lactamase class C family)